MEMLSKYFSLEEMTFSETAVRHGIDNSPDEAVKENLLNLCVHVLDPLRRLLGKPILVSSGFRCLLVNKLVGGSTNSQHIKGEAADIKVHGLTTEELFYLISISDIPFDQLIQEYDRWVHISFSATGINRRELLRATKEGSRTVYTKES